MPLQLLLDDLASWPGYCVPILEQAARLHHRSVWIHLFLNGNGRWLRMLSNIWLSLNGHPLTFWPEQIIGSVSILRQEYLSAIKTADAGDTTHLLQLQNRSTG